MYTLAILTHDWVNEGISAIDARRSSSAPFTSLIKNLEDGSLGVLLGIREDADLKVPRRLRASALRVSFERPSSREPMTKDQECL